MFRILKASIRELSVMLLLVLALLSCGKGRSLKIEEARAPNPPPIQEPQNPPVSPPSPTPPINPKEFSIGADVKTTSEPYTVTIMPKLREGVKPVKVFFKPDAREDFSTTLPLSAIQDGIILDYGEPGVFKAEVTIFDEKRNIYRTEPRIRSFNPQIVTKGKFLLFNASYRPTLPGWPEIPSSLKGVSAEPFKEYKHSSWNFMPYWADLDGKHYLSPKPQVYSIGPLSESDDGLYTDNYSETNVNNLTVFEYRNFEWIYDNWEMQNYFEDGVLDQEDLYKGMRHHLEWSPDGTEVVFTSNHEVWPVGWPPKILHNDIYTMNGDGTFIRRVTDDTNTKGRVSFSPDATYVVYDWREQDNRELNRRIAILDLATGESVELTDGTYDDYFATFTPDGKNILFTRRNLNGRHYSLMKTDLRGVNTIPFLTEEASHPVFSPAGDRLATTVYKQRDEKYVFVGFLVLKYPSLEPIIEERDFGKKWWPHFVEESYDPPPFCVFTPWGDEIMMTNNMVFIEPSFQGFLPIGSWRPGRPHEPQSEGDPDPFLIYPVGPISGGESGFFSPQSWPKGN